MIRSVAILTVFSIFRCIVNCFELIANPDLQVFEVFVMYSSRILLLFVFVAVSAAHMIALRVQVSFLSKFREEEGVKMQPMIVQDSIATSI